MVVCADHGEAIISGATVVEAGAAVEAAGEAEEGPEVPVPGANPLRPLLGCDPNCSWPDSLSELRSVSLWLSFMRLSSTVFFEKRDQRLVSQAGVLGNGQTDRQTKVTLGHYSTSSLAGFSEAAWASASDTCSCTPSLAALPIFRYLKQVESKGGES